MGFSNRFLLPSQKTKLGITDPENKKNDIIVPKSSYKPLYEDEINNITQKILGRDEFSFNLDEDAFYQQYKDKYIQQASLASEDAMGRAAAMTGGYGNSYAQSVGQQAYEAQLDELNDVSMDLYALALENYAREGDKLYDQLSMLTALENQNYEKFRDKVEDARYNKEFGYTEERDKAADTKWWADYYAGLGSGESEEDAITWMPTGTNEYGGLYGTEAFPVYRSSDGKTQAFGKFYSPYTGTVNPDVENGVMPNGYQPDNIGGEKLEIATIKGLPVDYKGKPIYTVGDRYYIWDENNNEYREVELTD